MEAGIVLQKLFLSVVPNQMNCQPPLMSNVLGVYHGVCLYIAGYAIRRLFCVPLVQHSRDA